MRILSFNITHDSSVCALNDGKIEFFCKEERLSRVKRDKSPFKALDLYSSINLGNIDHFIFGSPSNHETEIRDFFHIFIQKKFRSCKLNEYGHHLSHAMLAFTNSNFEKSLVFVIDRDGSVVILKGKPVARECESVYIFDRNKHITDVQKSFYLYSEIFQREYVHDYLQSLHPRTKVSIHNSFSIVRVYEAATTLIGQNPLENGKTMGLSSYGETLNYSSLFDDDIPLAHKFSIDFNNRVHFFNEERLIQKNLTSDNYQYYANKAKQVQIQTQEQVYNLINKYVEMTGINNVCIVGGYALNVVANNFYMKKLPHVNFYFEPVADDTGVSIGAAMLKHWEVTNTMPESLKDNFYHYYDSFEVINAGTKSSINEVINLLKNQKSVAIFEGNPEAGPRALGHRSILFDPRNANAKEIVNKIKKREWYRPFAGTILESEFSKYFDNLDLERSPFMTINFDCREGTQQFVPGIVHVDGTCRIQTVNDGFFFELLTLFFRETGCPMLLNTSFNLAGQPLVQTKKDAIETFNSSALDALYFVDDNILLKK